MGEKWGPYKQNPKTRPYVKWCLIFHALFQSQMNTTRGIPTGCFLEHLINPMDSHKKEGNASHHVAQILQNMAGENNK